MAVVLVPDRIVWALLGGLVIGDGCWAWRRARTGGYGVFKAGGQHYRAHRVAYELFRGPIPEGTEIDHLCRTPGCCRPSHLEAVSHRENVLRGVSPSAVLARSESCAQGHRRSANNIVGGRWGRVCRACKNLRERESYQRRKARGSATRSNPVYRARKQEADARYRARTAGVAS